MKIMEIIKRVLFSEDSISQEIIIEKMKVEIEGLKKEYEDLVRFQEEIKTNPKEILSKEFNKKDKYIELMDHIKYKNINLIKEYEYWGMKYNILIELYNKLKEYILKIGSDILIEFNTDKYKQPVAIISPYSIGLHKILLIKNTFFEEDYILYNIENTDIIVADINSKEPNVLHGTFMMNMLIDTAKHLKTKEQQNLERIIVSDQMIKKLEKSDEYTFFQRLGFQRDGVNLCKKI